MRLLTLIEAPSHPKLTSEMMDQIRAWRHECRAEEGGGGMCHVVSEIIQMKWGWDRISGTYCSSDGEPVCTAHYWNIMPNGSLLDSTADQLGSKDDIKIVPPDDPEFKQYRLEWSQDYHPGHPDIPDDDPVHGEEWSGEFDDEWTDDNPRPAGWHLGDDKEAKGRLRDYYRQWLKHADANPKAGSYMGSDKFAKRKLADLGESPQQYPHPKVMTADQIEDYVLSIHAYPEDMGEGDLQERIHSFSQYHLIQMDPKSIPDFQWGVDEHLRDQYAEDIRSGSPPPPIVIQGPGYVVIDGAHRLAAALYAGLTKISVYIGYSQDAVPDEDNPYAGNDDLHETFFSANIDVLMPIINGLMQTAARPLIFKLWKHGSKNAVLALAALKRLQDKGDSDPLKTLYQQSDLDVPMQFLKRLAWEAGLRDIPGVGHKPGLLPTGGLSESGEPLAEDGTTKTVYHVTDVDNVPKIQKAGLVPMIGPNSADIGERHPAVHVFLDKASLEDAVMNWGLMNWDEGELSLITLEVPTNIVDHSPHLIGGHGIIYQIIPPSMITSIAELY